MFYRIIYACIQAWKYKKLLTKYTTDPSLQSASIIDLSPQQLLLNGIKGLVIDFDGVLAAYAEKQPLAIAEEWLRNCYNVFGDNRIFILSNKPTLERKNYFAEHFAKIAFIIAKYKKPFPHSILDILQTTKLSPTELLVIDDRLLTGILAAIVSNVPGCLITKPFIDYTTNPIRERIYTLVRLLERWLFSCKY